MDAIDRAAAALKSTRPHNPILCGRAPETDCPDCIVKFLPLRHLQHLEERLAAMDIDAADLSTLIFRDIKARLDDLIAERLEAPLRVVQLTLWDFFEDDDYREELRTRLRDLLVDDIIQIAELVYAKKQRQPRTVRGTQASAGKGRR